MSPDQPSMPLLRRRSLLAVFPALVLTGCGSSAPVALYHLKSEPPADAAAPASPAGAGTTWQLMLPVRLPDYLDREAILLPRGETGLLALSGHRWAEALRDAVPRVLRNDLARLRGESRIVSATPPASVGPWRQLRVELLAFEAEADQGGVRLAARWSLTDPNGQQPIRQELASLRAATGAAAAGPAGVPAADRIDALVAAHRLALWQLAQRISVSGNESP